MVFELMLGMFANEEDCVTEYDDKQIIQSWHTNAEAWIYAVQNSEIESRNLVTNQAIIEAVMELNPSTALDIGCGEGWLSRALLERNVDVLGVDVVPDLIDSARKISSGEYRVCSYRELAYDQVIDSKFDTVICNFSLIGKEDVNDLIAAIPKLLNNKGVLLVQTLHPLMYCEEGECEDGWREGSWDGFGSKFRDPAPWYYRTKASWERLLGESGFINIECREPGYPGKEKPVSILFISEVEG